MKDLGEVIVDNHISEMYEQNVKKPDNSTKIISNHGTGRPQLRKQAFQGRDHKSRESPRATGPAGHQRAKNIPDFNVKAQSANT